MNSIRHSTNSASDGSVESQVPEPTHTVSSPSSTEDKTLPTPPSITPDQLAALEPREREYWKTWTSAPCIAGRHEDIWNPDGSPRKALHWNMLRTGYVAKLEAMTMEQLRSETYQMIYHSARCAGNRRPTDWDWMVDCCYSELMRRTFTDKLYGFIHKQVERDHCA